MDQQGAGRTRSGLPDGGVPAGTGPLAAASPGYGATGHSAAGSGAQRVLDPGTGPQRLIGSGSGAQPVLGRGSGAQPVLGRGSGAQPVLDRGSGAQPVLGAPGSLRAPGTHGAGSAAPLGRTPARGFPPVREPVKTPPDGFRSSPDRPGETPPDGLGSSPGGFGPWHAPRDLLEDQDGEDTNAPDDADQPDRLAPVDADRAVPPGRRRGGRTRRRGRSRVAWLVTALVVAACAGLGWYRFLYEPRVNAPVPPTLRLPTNAPGSPGFDQALGKWQHIGTRGEDPMPLTITELYPARFVLNGRSYVRTAASVTKTCSVAVYGADLQAALQSGHCTQVVRASYISGDGTMMGTVGVVNLNTSSAAQKAGQVTGPQEIIAPLSGKKGATSKLGNGTGVVQAVIKGHYLILM